jgi:DNA recombination protein RmuC
METLNLLITMVALAIVMGAVVVIRTGQTRAQDQAQRLSDTQAELAGRLAQMGEAQAAAQTHINMTLEQRLDTVSKRISDGLNHHTEKTDKTMSNLHERLAVIDSAQKNLTNLSEQVVGLQDILSNKQARGAFGEVQLNDLVSSILPPSAFEFQATLSNGKRADCLLKLPNPPGGIVVDAKFPLESYRALVDAKTETSTLQASRSFSADIKKHVRSIAERYIVPGETAESALMFLPSEAVYMELHTNFLNVVEDSYRSRVMIVSPTSLMAILNTVRAVLKDVTMREQAGLIQAEVLKLLEDVERMDDRVEKLARHFGNVATDINDIQTSSKKVSKRGERIQDIELGQEPQEKEIGTPHLVSMPGSRVS